MSTLSIKSFGPIHKADITFGDFTLLVGAQATGKSILLQMLKFIIDRHNISHVLKTNNYDWGKAEMSFQNSFFGESMSHMWNDDTEVKFENKIYTPITFMPKQGVGERAREEKLFYIPAQRVVTMSQGWPRAFGAYDIGDPYVIKQFSETVRVLMEREATRDKEGMVFPRPKRIKEPIRKMLDASIFHGAKVESDTSSMKKRFVLKVGESRLPFMTWSAGQKEFMPLLLSFYHLMPGAKVAQRDSIKWVVIEEPEMGLHPQAIQSLMVVFLDLIAKGYKVIISTHSPVLLELAWVMHYIKEYKGTPKDLFELFSLPKDASLQKIFEVVIEEKSFHTYYFDQTEKGVDVKDISSLDAGSDDRAVSDWGGISQFAGKASDVVSKLVSDED